MMESYLCLLRWYLRISCTVRAGPHLCILILDGAGDLYRTVQAGAGEAWELEGRRAWSVRRAPKQQAFFPHSSLSQCTIIQILSPMISFRPDVRR